MYITRHSISRATRLQLHPNHLTMRPVSKPGAAQRAAFLLAARAGLGGKAEFVCWDVPAVAGGNGDATSSLHHTAHKSAWTDGGEQGGRFPGHQLVHAFCIPPKHEASPAGCTLLRAQSFLGPQEPKRLSARSVWAKQNRQSLPLNSNENAQHSLWEEDDTNHIPKEFTSIISISSCPEAAGCSNASCHRLGAARSAGVHRQTPLGYVVCSHCLMSAQGGNL